MLFDPRISTTHLAGLSHRLATALAAGIDVRTAWAHEVKRARTPGARARLGAVSEAVNRGESIRDALAQTGEFFPPLFRELADVGDQSGHLDHAFGQLAQHYQEQIRRRRSFLLIIAWPLIELGVAVGIIGLFIFGLGLAESYTGTTTDVLGGGLVGGRGLLIYAAFLAAVAAAVVVVVVSVRRGLVWTRPVQIAILRVPVVGRAVEAFAMERLAWSLQVTLNAGMAIRRAVGLSLRSTRNAKYTDHAAGVDAWIESGNSLYETFLDAGCFPDDFLDAVHVGEQTGSLVESMGGLAQQYRERADAAMKILGIAGFFVVSGMIMLVIILFIFRIALFYVNTIYDAMPQ